MVRCFFVLSFFCLLCTFATAQQKVRTDHHVHIFSEDLLKYLKSQRLLSNSFKREDLYYTDIDTIRKHSGAQKIWLISTGYAYSGSQSLENEIRLQLNEHQYLHNAASKFPNQIEAFYSVNPLKDYALQLVKRAHKNLVFKGIKLHFQSSQIEFRNQHHVRQLKELFSYTGQHDIPVILHFQNHKNSISKSEIDYFFKFVIPKQYNHQLIFTHLASAGWLKENDLTNAKYIKTLGDDSQNIDVKFDLSGVIHDGFKNLDLATMEQLSDLIKYIGHKNLLFGSDYPLYTSSDYLMIMQKALMLSRKQWRRILRNTCASKS